jgi:inhibitor of KinA sporulation pathway (predicted exonuclease)
MSDEPLRVLVRRWQKTLDEQEIIENAFEMEAVRCKHHKPNMKCSWAGDNYSNLKALMNCNIKQCPILFTPERS